METVGKEKHAAYYESVVKDRTCSIHEPIKKNSLPLFRCPTPKTKSKKAGQISMLKHDVELFSRLYIVTQTRDGDLGTFFQHENHPYPPSLSDRGKLRQGKKSELLNILLQESQTEKESPVSFDVKILDGAVIVHLLSPANATTFDDYANNIFIPYIKIHLHVLMWCGIPMLLTALRN